MPSKKPFHRQQLVNKIIAGVQDVVSQQFLVTVTLDSEYENRNRWNTQAWKQLGDTLIKSNGPPITVSRLSLPQVNTNGLKVMLRIDDEQQLTHNNSAHFDESAVAGILLRSLDTDSTAHALQMIDAIYYRLFWIEHYQRALPLYVIDNDQLREITLQEQWCALCDYQQNSDYCERIQHLPLWLLDVPDDLVDVGIAERSLIQLLLSHDNVGLDDNELTLTNPNLFSQVSKQASQFDTLAALLQLGVAFNTDDVEEIKAQLPTLCTYLSKAQLNRIKHQGCNLLADDLAAAREWLQAFPAQTLTREESLLLSNPVDYWFLRIERAAEADKTAVFHSLFNACLASMRIAVPEANLTTIVDRITTVCKTSCSNLESAQLLKSAIRQSAPNFNALSDTQTHFIALNLYVLEFNIGEFWQHVSSAFLKKLSSNLSAIIGARLLQLITTENVAAFTKICVNCWDIADFEAAFKEIADNTHRMKTTASLQWYGRLLHCFAQKNSGLFMNTHYYKPSCEVANLLTASPIDVDKAATALTKLESVDKDQQLTRVIASLNALLTKQQHFAVLALGDASDWQDIYSNANEQLIGAVDPVVLRSSGCQQIPTDSNRWNEELGTVAVYIRAGAFYEAVPLYLTLRRKPVSDPLATLDRVIFSKSTLHLADDTLIKVGICTLTEPKRGHGSRWLKYGDEESLTHLHQQALTKVWRLALAAAKHQYREGTLHIVSPVLGLDLDTVANTSDQRDVLKTSLCTLLTVMNEFATQAADFAERCVIHLSVASSKWFAQCVELQKANDLPSTQGYSVNISNLDITDLAHHITQQDNIDQAVMILNPSEGSQIGARCLRTAASKYRDPETEIDHSLEAVLADRSSYLFSQCLDFNPTLSGKHCHYVRFADDGSITMTHGVYGSELAVDCLSNQSRYQPTGRNDLASQLTRLLAPTTPYTPDVSFRFYNNQSLSAASKLNHYRQLRTEACQLMQTYVAFIGDIGECLKIYRVILSHKAVFCADTSWSGKFTLAENSDAWSQMIRLLQQRVNQLSTRYAQPENNPCFQQLMNEKPLPVPQTHHDTFGSANVFL